MMTGDDDTMVGAAADPTTNIPQPAQETPALAWADDDCDEPATQSAQAAADGWDEPGTESWAATINYAVFLIACALIAAAVVGVFAWVSMSSV